MSVVSHGIELREPSGKKRFSILITGDICPCGEKAGKIIREGRAKEIASDFSNLFSKTDLRIVQWETVLAKDEFQPIMKSGPNLKCDPETVKLASVLPADVALLANNHTADYGPESCLATREILHKNNIETVGAGENISEAEKPLFLNSCGRKIAILNVCEHEFTQAGRRKAGAAPLNPLRNAENIRKAKKEADFVIIAIHGGNEHNPFPSPRVLNLCRAFADAGADLVYNCHPHCAQGAEFYKGVPIVYSPGNFFFPKLMDGGYPRSWFTGYIPRFLLDEKGVYAIEIHPYRLTEEKIIPLRDADEKAFFERFSMLCETLKDEEKIEAYFDAWCADHSWILDTARGNPLPGDLSNPETIRQYLGLRNLFTCEAHCEVSENFLILLEENRIEEAKKLLPEIKRLQNPPWID